MLVLFVGTAELALRLLAVKPRAQVISLAFMDEAGTPAKLVGGEYLWESDPTLARVTCPPGASRTLMTLGTSITFGIELPAAQVFTHHLQTRLDAREPGRWCVINGGEPGFTIRQMAARYDQLRADHPPDVVMLELGNLGRYARVGPELYNVSGFALGASGLPEVVPLPTGLQQLLYEHSRAWAWVSLALAPRASLAWDDPDSGPAAALALGRRIQDDGASLVAWTPTNLTDVIRVPSPEITPDADAVRDAFAAGGVTTLDIRAAWEGVDPRPWALSQVHLNVEGHKALAATVDATLVERGLIPGPADPRR